LVNLPQQTGRAVETLHAITTRRSIRKFTGKNIPEELLTKILEAAMYAPSARNTQPWHFVVITNKELLGKIPHIHPYAEMCYDAGAAILVCGDTAIENLEGYLALNCGASSQNVLLAAHDLGLGSVWLGVYPRKERMEPITKLFNLPLNIIPISLIALGYPDEKVQKPARFKEERIHLNRW
jgi:nitroreductase